MLKKRVLQITLLSSLALLSACDSGTSQEPTDEESEQDTEQTSETEEEEEIVDQTEEPTEEETSENEVESVKEEPAYLYEVSDNYAYINVIEGEEANERVALLTYDDAPDGNTLELAEILQERDAPAIFFVNGMYIEDEKGQETLKKVYDMGFEIGNHTQTHPNLQQISEEKQYDEIIETSDLIEEVTGERPRFFRAPHGANTDFSTETVLEDGMMLMNWTYGYDWQSEYQDPDALADIMINTELLVPGANLLMHDREWTKKAAPAIIDGLREQDYELLDPALIRSVDSEHDVEESEEENE